MLHDIDIAMNWCRRCGRPVDELFEKRVGQCTGSPGTEHKNYLLAKQRAEVALGALSDETRQ